MMIESYLASTIANSNNGTEYTSLTHRLDICDDPPGSGSWTITDSCSIIDNVTFNNDITVNDGVTLAIPDTVDLNLDLSDYTVLVKDGGKLLVKNGGEMN